MIPCFTKNIKSRFGKKSYLFAIVGAEHILKLLPKGTHDHKRFIKPSELGEFARKSTLCVEGLIGMTYNPFTKVYRLEKDVSVNYLMHCEKP